MENFNRIEFKHLIKKDVYEKFLKELKEYVKLDEYNLNGKPYSIFNIYYDSDKFYLARYALLHKDYKTKVRMRAYNRINHESTVYIEQKEKIDGIVFKERKEIPLIDIYNSTIKIKDIELEPQSFIFYERLAFIGNEDPNLRITFDFNIIGQKVNRTLTLIEDEIKLTNDIVLEIKTNDGVPNWLLELLAKYHINNTQFSKYMTWFKKQKKQKQKEKNEDEFDKDIE